MLTWFEHALIAQVICCAMLLAHSVENSSARANLLRAGIRACPLSHDGSYLHYGSSVIASGASGRHLARRTKRTIARGGERLTHSALRSHSKRRLIGSAAQKLSAMLDYAGAQSGGVGESKNRAISPNNTEEERLKVAAVINQGDVATEL
jgi:hypothetical protein